MIRSARLLLLCLAAAGCGQKHGNIISIANEQDLAPPVNGAEIANVAAPAGNAAGNAQASSDSHDQVLRTETVSGTFTGWEMGAYLGGHTRVAARPEPISAQPGPTPI